MKTSICGVTAFGLLLLLVSPGLTAQSPGSGGGAAGEFPTAPEWKKCSYTIAPILGPPSRDIKHASDDFCSASAAGAVYSGEADVDWNSLSSAAASFIGWKMKHIAVTAGAYPCTPVSYEDDLTIFARVEAKLTGLSGARYAQVGGIQSLGSTVLPPTTAVVAAANNDSGTPVTIAIPLPASGMGGAGHGGSTSITVANPTPNSTSAQEQSVHKANLKVTETNFADGLSSMQIGAGGNSLFSGGGRARVVRTNLDYTSVSVCSVHGVSLGFSGYSDKWWSSMTSF